MSSMETESKVDISDENYKKRMECIQDLRKRMKDDVQLKNLQSDDDYLLRFLYSCDFNASAAFERMKCFYELLLEFPEWYTKNGPLELKHIIEKDIRVMTYQRDKEGRPIYIVKVGNTDVSKMQLMEVISVDDFWFEYISNDSGALEKGLSIIVDIKGFSWKLMKWMTPHNIKVGMKKLEAHPMKEYKFHVVNSAFLISAAIKFVLPFLSERLRNMIKFHFDDWESLHEHISPDMLPVEYGGKGQIDFRKCYEDLFTKNNEIVCSFKVNRILENC